jgi:hypothetical protein
MIGIVIGLAILGAVLTQGSAIFVPALMNAGASFCATGVLANFARDPGAAPNWAATVSMLTTVIALILVSGSFIVN